MQVNNNPNRQNFTSVVRMKVFKNGVETTDKSVVTATMRGLSKILKGQGKSYEEYEVFAEFARNDKDFTNGNGVVKSSVPIKRVGKYLLTGKHADILDFYGKDLGAARAKVAKSRVLDADKFVDMSLNDALDWVERASANYANKIKELLNSADNRVKNPYGDLLDLRVNVAKDEGMRKSSLKIKEAFFQKKGAHIDDNKSLIEMIPLEALR